jgi:hypothetical protein
MWAILTLVFSCDAHHHFEVNENVGFAIPNDVGTILLSQTPKASSRLAPIENPRP